MGGRWENILTMIWEETGLVVSLEKARTLLQRSTLHKAFQFGVEAAKADILSDVAKRIAGCEWPEEEIIKEDPLYLDYFINGLQHLAEDAGVEVYHKEQG